MHIIETAAYPSKSSKDAKSIAMLLAKNNVVNKLNQLKESNSIRLIPYTGLTFTENNGSLGHCIQIAHESIRMVESKYVQRADTMNNNYPADIVELYEYSLEYEII